ncbi:hypothetical protein ACLI09_09580 [Flavobacterium sp. RHBU_24]|uniref:hypothetical protein n=1 Tax=Flavobacterium sp. RHBU_24 TaxID=3391185 RepID=UPI0039851700
MNLRISFIKRSDHRVMAESISKKAMAFPDDRLFNWKEITEILVFVSRYMDYKGWMSPITAKKLEWEIKTLLPYTVKTHYDVMVWLDNNFKR